MDTTSRLSSTDSYFRWKQSHNNTGTNVVKWFNLVISVIKHTISLAFFCNICICQCVTPAVYLYTAGNYLSVEDPALES